jgi:predicted Zn-dependent peptidase
LILSETLASGARLLLEPVDRTDTLCIGIWFLHGSRDEGPEERGFSHFMEHMLFKGTSSRSAMAIAREIDRVGGFLNAFTEKETTCVYALLPKEHMALAFDVLSDMAFSSVLDEREMEKEKAVIVNEILSLDDSPEEKGHERFVRGMWADHALARKITGEVEEVRGINRDRLLEFYGRRFTPANAVIAVAGNFDPSKARDLSAAAFAGMAAPGGAPSRIPPPASKFTGFEPDRFTQVQIFAGTTYPLDRDIDHYYDSLVFSTAFGESMSSRLFQSLREELGLCYTVYSFRNFFSDTGLFTIYANATPALAKKLLFALDGELARLVREPLSEAEIEDARSHLVGSMILSKEDMESRMKRMVRQFCMIDRSLEFEESVERIRKVDASGIEKFVSTYVRRDAFSLLAFGTKGVKTLLKEFDFSF